MGMSLMVINHSNLTTTAPISSPPLSQKERYGIRATPSAKVFANFFCYMEEGREKDGKKMKKKKRKTNVSGEKRNLRAQTARHAPTGSAWCALSALGNCFFLVLSPREPYKKLYLCKFVFFSFLYPLSSIKAKKTPKKLLVFFLVL